MRKLIPALFFTIAFLLSGCAQESKTPNKPQAVNLASKTPILLVHGSGGGIHSFDELADRLTNEYQLSNERLTVTVENDGSLNYSGHLTKNAKRPLIVVAFSQNSAEPTEWAEGLEAVIADLHSSYQLDTFDAVGHSNGGLALTHYLESKKAKNTPKLKKLVVIGSPFNDLEGEDNIFQANFTDVTKETATLKDFLSKQKLIPDKLEVLSIAGNLAPDKENDGIVPLESALASRLIFKNHSQVYIEKVQTGENAVHQTLHETEETAKQINWFLKNDRLSTKKIFETTN
ncbi:alpha/beta hydrolase [Listeria sp. PSOL-1]|uniref:alpha/beta hydrolase n=1 Tax=Listeria sp. PSOL-1 TaxID=1844999 RepID=UPI0013D6961F|nr:alpha/beta hydrolase [Listeria sp. PSOL-1]